MNELKLICMTMTKQRMMKSLFCRTAVAALMCIPYTQAWAEDVDGTPVAVANTAVVKGRIVDAENGILPGASI